MSQLSKLTHSRNQWKYKAKLRGEGERYQRKQNARLKAQYNRTRHALNSESTPYGYNSCKISR